MEHVWSLVHAERAALIDDLEHVDDHRWEVPSLCREWTVHDVVAHLVDSARTTRLGFLVGLARAGFDFDRVLDGFHRDTPKVLEQDWPMFSRGSYAHDAGVRKSVIDFRVPVEIGGTRVTPGDLVFGDRDGVLVVPAEVETEVLERALEMTTRAARGDLRARGGGRAAYR